MFPFDPLGGRGLNQYLYLNYLVYGEGTHLIVATIQDYLSYRACDMSTRLDVVGIRVQFLPPSCNTPRQDDWKWDCVEAGRAAS